MPPPTTSRPAGTKVAMPLGPDSHPESEAPARQCSAPQGSAGTSGLLLQPRLTHCPRPPGEWRPVMTGQLRRAIQAPHHRSQVSGSRHPGGALLVRGTRRVTDGCPRVTNRPGPGGLPWRAAGCALACWALKAHRLVGWRQQQQQGGSAVSRAAGAAGRQAGWLLGDVGRVPHGGPARAGPTHPLRAVNVPDCEHWAGPALQGRLARLKTAAGTLQHRSPTPAAVSSAGACASGPPGTLLAATHVGQAAAAASDAAWGCSGCSAAVSSMPAGWGAAAGWGSSRAGWGSSRAGRARCRQPITCTASGGM